MRTLTLTLPDDAVADLERAAAVEGAQLDELAERLLVAALRGIARERGTVAWERLKAVPTGIDEATAEAIAREALVQVRGERDAPRR